MDTWTDDMGRTVSADDITNCENLRAKLKLMASLEGPLQRHLKDIAAYVDRLEGSYSDLEGLVGKMRTKQSALTDALMGILEPSITDLLREDANDAIRDIATDAASDAISEFERRVDDQINDTVSDAVIDMVSDLRIVRR